MISPLKIIISGAPASGKGTQCEYIRNEFNLVHLSTGDMLRAAVEAGTELGQEAKMFMSQGLLLPDETMIGIILSRLQEEDCRTRGWLLDGFPRTGAQAVALAKAGIHCDVFLQLEVPDEMLVERVVGRRLDPVTNKIYHMKYSPPETTDVEKRLIQREDDTNDKIVVRINAYRENLAAIIEKYSSMLHKFDGNRSPHLVWNEIRAKLTRIQKKEVIFVLGGPGSGKGTHCAKISDEFGYCHLSAGDLLREEIEKGGDLSAMINDFIVKGQLVPADVIVKCLANAMQKSQKKKFLIDGFPRNEENLQIWGEMMEGQYILDLVLFFDCPEDELKARLLKRGETSGRADDNIVTIMKRFKTFQEESLPALRVLENIGKVRTISTVPPQKVVYEKVRRLFRGLQLNIAPFQRTLALIKPDAVAAGFVPDILNAIEADNLNVIYTKMILMTDEVVCSFYAEHVGKSFFPTLKAFMMSGPALVIVIEGTDAIKRWRVLMGPTHTQTAKLTSPLSIRARFGTDGTRNATHGSDSDKSAIREINFWLNPNSIGFQTSIEPLLETKSSLIEKSIPIRDTYAMIKPVTSEIAYEQILDIIALHGFDVISEIRTTLSQDLVTAFYSEHRNQPFFKRLREYMTSGPVVGLHLRKEEAIKSWRYLIGYTNFERAKSERFDSIRANYAFDGTRNAVHGSDSTLSAQKELSFFFAIGGLPPNLIMNIGIAVNPPKPAAVVESPENEIVDADSSVKQSSDNVSRAEKNLMFRYLHNELTPIINGLVQRAMLQRPIDPLQFAIQDLMDQQSIAPSSPTRSPKTKLAPISSSLMKSSSSPAIEASSGVKISPYIYSPVKLGRRPKDQINDIQNSHGVGAKNNQSTSSSRLNPSFELYESLNQSRAEVAKLRSAISLIAKNITEPKMSSHVDEFIQNFSSLTESGLDGNSILSDISMFGLGTSLEEN